MLLRGVVFNVELLFDNAIFTPLCRAATNLASANWPFFSKHMFLVDFIDYFFFNLDYF